MLGSLKLYALQVQLFLLLLRSKFDIIHFKSNFPDLKLMYLCSTLWNCGNLDGPFQHALDQASNFFLKKIFFYFYFFILFYSYVL
jgi:hypothetical protein